MLQSLYLKAHEKKKKPAWKIAQRQEKIICIWIDRIIMNILYNWINPKVLNSWKFQVTCRTIFDPNQKSL